MKLLILSDIHANDECLKAILAKESGVDAIYCAGDLVDYGPHPAEAVELAREYGLRCVRGNHDDRLIRFWHEEDYRETPKNGLTWVCQNCRALNAGHVQWLESLPTHLCFKADGIAYLMTHSLGEGYRTIESRYHFDLYWEEHFTLTGCEGLPRRMIFGHTHRQSLQCFSADTLWMNPGSASYRRPDEPGKDAYYITVTDGKVKMRHIPYDRAPLYEEVKRLRPELSVEEYRVADFFFGWDEEDGPDVPWIKRNTYPMEMKK